MPMIASTSSAWPLPSTPAMPSDLALVDGRSRRRRRMRAAARRPARVRPRTVSTTTSVTVDSRVSGLGSSLPTISSASCAGGRRPRDRRWPTVVPRRMTVIASATDEHLVQLVRDEDDRQALALELAQVGEQLVDLLRHEHGGRLVQDQDPGAAVEDLEDLHPLPVADAQVLDQRVGVDAEAVARRRSRGSCCRAAPKSSRPPLRGLAAQDDVLQDGEVVGQHEVLVHHADAAPRSRRPGERKCTSRRRRGSCPRPAAACRTGSSSASTCRRRSRRRWRARCPCRTVMSMSWLATTPGNRLVIPAARPRRSRSASAAAACAPHRIDPALARTSRARDAGRTGPAGRYRVRPGRVEQDRISRRLGPEP